MHFLNTQKAPIASTTFWKNGPVFGRDHPEKWQNLPTVKQGVLEVSGGELGPTISVCGAFSFHVHRKAVQFLNIQEV